MTKAKERCTVSGCSGWGYRKVELWKGKPPVVMCLYHYTGFKKFVGEYGEGVEFKEERV